MQKSQNTNGPNKISKGKSWVSKVGSAWILETCQRPLCNWRARGQTWGGGRGLGPWGTGTPRDGTITRWKELTPKYLCRVKPRQPT